MFLSVYSLLWVSTTVIGLAGFPLFFVAFRWLPDRGYAVARYGSMILIAYFSWLAAHLGVSFGAWSVWGSLLLLVVVNGLIGFHFRHALRQYFRHNWRYMVTVELLFLIGLLFFLWLVAFNGAIDPDSERMMDYAMLQGVLKTTVFPQQDIWLSGHTVNYYYFGYLIVGILQLLTHLSLPFFFNGAVALIYALTLIGAYSVGYNFTMKHRYGFLASFMVLFCGNFNALVQLLAGAQFSTLNWFNCTRIIPGTINEFPWFSLLWGDLHPYMLAFPIVFIVFSFGLNFLFRFTFDINRTSHPLHPVNILQVLLWAILGGALIAVNTWDYPAYFMILVVSICLFPLFEPEGARIKHLGISLAHAAGLFLAGVFAYFPYLRVFEQQRSIRLVSAGRSLFTDFLQLFGLFIILFIVYWLIVIVRTPSASKRQGKWVLISFVWISAICLFRQTTYLYLIALTCFGGVALWLIWHEERRRLDDDEAYWHCLSPIATQIPFFVIAITILPLLYAFICEFWYVNDLYTGLLERQNTVFKVYLQIWFIWAISSVFAVYLVNDYLWRSDRHFAQWCFRIVLAVLILLGALYPVAGTLARTNGFKQRFTLDGMAYNRVIYPSDCAAIDWMNAHISGRPVILEAPGYAYCWNARISTFTGLPGIMGWLNHEAGWRNSYEEVLKRRSDMDLMYRTVSKEKAHQLMDDYAVEYVVVGMPERAEYTGYGLKKFADMMDRVYDQSGVAIYKRRQ